MASTDRGSQYIVQSAIYGSSMGSQRFIFTLVIPDFVHGKAPNGGGEADFLGAHFGKVAYFWVVFGISWCCTPIKWMIHPPACSEMSTISNLDWELWHQNHENDPRTGPTQLSENGHFRQFSGFRALPVLHPTELDDAPTSKLYWVPDFHFHMLHSIFRARERVEPSRFDVSTHKRLVEGAFSVNLALQGATPNQIGPFNLQIV